MKRHLSNLWAILVALGPIAAITYDAIAGNTAWVVFWGVAILWGVIDASADKIVRELRRSHGNARSFR